MPSRSSSSNDDWTRFPYPVRQLESFTLGLVRPGNIAVMIEKASTLRRDHGRETVVRTGRSPPTSHVSATCQLTGSGSRPRLEDLRSRPNHGLTTVVTTARSLSQPKDNSSLPLSAEGCFLIEQTLMQRGRNPVTIKVEAVLSRRSRISRSCRRTFLRGE